MKYYGHCWQLSNVNECLLGSAVSALVQMHSKKDCKMIEFRQWTSTDHTDPTRGTVTSMIGTGRVELSF